VRRATIEPGRVTETTDTRDGHVAAPHGRGPRHTRGKKRNDDDDI
jgi:hypothetical protein